MGHSSSKPSEQESTRKTTKQESIVFQNMRNEVAMALTEQSVEELIRLEDVKPSKRNLIKTGIDFILFLEDNNRLSATNVRHLKSILTEAGQANALSTVEEYEVKLRGRYSSGIMSNNNTIALKNAKTLLIDELPIPETVNILCSENILEELSRDFIMHISDKTGQVETLIRALSEKNDAAYNDFLELKVLKSRRIDARIREMEPEKLIKKMATIELALSPETELAETEPPQTDQQETELPQEDKIINVMIVGKTGHGKSASGNLIVGEHKAFREFDGTKSGTKKNSTNGSTEYNGYKFLIADTPGLFDTSKFNGDILKDIVDMAMNFPFGIDVFLMVLNASVRLTREEKDAFEIMEKQFGDIFWGHTIIVVTHAGTFLRRRKSIKNIIDDDKDLKRICAKIPGGIISLENGEDSNGIIVHRALQRKMALSAMIHLVETNEGSKYTNELFTVARDQLENKMKNHQLLRETDEHLFKKYVVTTTQSLDIEDIDNDLESAITTFLAVSSDALNKDCISVAAKTFKEFHESFFLTPKTKENEHAIQEAKVEATEKQKKKNVLREHINFEGEIVIVEYVKYMESENYDRIFGRAKIGMVDKELLGNVNKTLPVEFQSEDWEPTVSALVSQNVMLHIQMNREIKKRIEDIVKVAKYSSLALGFLGVFGAVMVESVAATAALSVVATGGFIIPVVVGGVAIAYVIRKNVSGLYLKSIFKFFRKGTNPCLHDIK